MLKYISLLALFTLPSYLWANHPLGGNIQYRCLGNNQYLVELNLFSEDDNTANPTTINIDISSGNCSQNFSATLQLDSLKSGRNTVPYCSSNTNNFIKDILLVYSDTVNLPQNCTDWILSYTNSANRLASITNITNASSASFYLQAKLNNSNGACYDSPQVQSEALLYSLGENRYFAQVNAYTNSKDQIRYTLVTPLVNQQIPLPYISAFSIEQPFATMGNTPIALDSLTGAFAFTPANFTQIAIFNVLIERLHNGQVIASTQQEVFLRNYNAMGVSNGLQLQRIVTGNGLAVNQEISTLFFCDSSSRSMEFHFRDYGQDSIVLDTQHFNLEEVFGAGAVDYQLLYPTGRGDSLILKVEWLQEPQEDSLVFCIATRNNHCLLSALYKEHFIWRKRPLNIQLSPSLGNNNSIQAQVQGGTPPYSYLWHTGSTDSTINIMGNGLYSLTLTDAVGCRQEESLVFNSSQDLVATDNKVSIYPNPTAQQIQLRLEFPLATPGQIELYTAQGKLCKRIQINSGEIQKIVSLVDYPAGVYTIRLVLENKLEQYQVIKL